MYFDILSYFVVSSAVAAAVAASGCLFVFSFIIRKQHYNVIALPMS